MGEVYKARDTRLDGTVAIKVLPPDVSGDPDRRARFEREAKTIAGLNHAHICTLYDVGDHDGAMFLVMEHLAGQTLADRLQKGPLPLDQALTIAADVADALSAAHRQGVIHRDLKPANVMLTKGGAKLLDFGLAKLTGHGEQPAASYAASAASTQTATLTGQGRIVGTLQYMAPEQLEGKPADARTDLWALGAILHEMVTGERAFEGTSAVSLMSAIMEREPARIATLRPRTPPALDRLVRDCLQSQPTNDRTPHTTWRTCCDRSARMRLARAAAMRALPVTHWLVQLAVVVAALTGILAAATWLFRDPVVAPPTAARVLLTIVPAEEVRSASPGFSLLTPAGSRTAFAWTPDERGIVFAGQAGGEQQLYLRCVHGPVTARGPCRIVADQDRPDSRLPPRTRTC